MFLPSFPLFAHLPCRRRLAEVLCPGLVVLALGCADSHLLGKGSVEGVTRAVGQDKKVHAEGVVLAAAQELPTYPLVPTKEQHQEERLPSLPETPKVAKLGVPSPSLNKVVPINLDTVLRLAETQNGQTAVAREKLQEAFANQQGAANAWLPDLWVGGGWYRHDGGIALEDGTLLHSSFSSMFAGLEINGRLDLRDAVYKKVEAERRVWQQRAEAAKINTEALLEASSTYVDLLSARAAESITLKTQGYLHDLLKQAEGLEKTLPAAAVDVARIQTEIHGQEMLLRKFREIATSAMSKLIYLLGLDPASELVIADRHLLAFNLVDASQPVDVLVAQAQTHGPGIHELEGLLFVIQEARAKDSGLSQMLPVFDIRMAEGGFGTGPGDRMDWDNRWDFGVQMRWNLTEWVTRREKQRATLARIGQAHATFQDMRAKLTMGVQESREGTLSARDQMDIGVKQLKHATDAYERSKNRMANAPNFVERSPSEVLLSIRALSISNLAYLMAIRDHDKAQLRLAILTGTMGVGHDH